LKIDHSFISDLASAPNNAVLTAMAHSLGLEVIAEGVEIVEQLKFLNMHDCNDVQGYLWATRFLLKSLLSYYTDYPPKNLH